eukprot:2433649-Rhodomonas_salina.2
MLQPSLALNEFKFKLSMAGPARRLTLGQEGSSSLPPRCSAGGRGAVAAAASHANAWSPTPSPLALGPTLQAATLLSSAFPPATFHAWPSARRVMSALRH